MRVALVQMHSGRDRDENVEHALGFIDQAVDQGAEFIALPEYMTYLGDYEGFPGASESVPGPTSKKLAAKARQHRVFIHCGSLIEKTPQPDRFYNSSLLFDAGGNLIGYYRKIHLFDVDVPGGVTDMESSAILAGDSLVTVDLPDFKLGMSICFDLRFPELYRQLAVHNAEVLIIPAAFAVATGRVHWEILLRARAIENHAFVLAPAQCGQDPTGSCCYGHSMIIDPWGEIIAELENDEGMILKDLDQREVVRRRHQVPVLQMRRPDLYRQQPVKGNV